MSVLREFFYPNANRRASANKGNARNNFRIEGWVELNYFPEKLKKFLFDTAHVLSKMPPSPDVPQPAD